MCTKNLQTKHFTLSQGQKTLEATKEVCDEKAQEFDPPMNFPLTRRALSSANPKFRGNFQNVCLQKGVIKIQEGRHSQLTAGERHACNCLTKVVVYGDDIGPPDAEGNESSDIDGTDALSRINSASKHRRYQDNDPCVNCDFVLCSDAEADRVWSTCLRILTLARSTLFPLTLKTISFLKHNSDWWGMADVQEAMGMDLSSLNDDEQENVLMSNDEESELNDMI